MKGERGTSLIETVVALALLGIIGAAFLSALGTSSNSRLLADEHDSARIIAESQMENIRKQTYAFSYDAVPVLPEYPGYSSVVELENMRNGNIQKIAVTIRHYGRDITTLESYKVNR